jgi:S1-C subfamily serine protease
MRKTFNLYKRHYMKPLFLPIFFVLLSALIFPVCADGEPAEILKAITKIRAIIPENARTAKLLGTEREGNGVVINSEGHVLTIGYLVLEAEKIEILGSNGQTFNATFTAYDHNSGFGLIKAKSPINVKPITLGKSSEINVGDRVLVASYGGEDSVQGARVISRKEFAGYWEYLLEDAIFTAPPHPNYGGAAMIGRDGKLIGIGSLFTQTDIEGIGMIASNMFVPIDHLKPILADLIVRGRSSKPPKPWLGLYAEEVRGRVFVTRLAPGGPAEKAGMQTGDIILTVNKQKTTGLSDFYRKVWGIGIAGVDVPLEILQGIQIRDIIIHSEDRYSYLKTHKLQ